MTTLKPLGAYSSIGELYRDAQAQLEAERKARKEAEHDYMKMDAREFDASRRAIATESRRREVEADQERLNELQRRFLAMDTGWGSNKETVLIFRWDNISVSASIRETIDHALAPLTATPIQAHSKSQYKRLVTQGAITAATAESPTEGETK